jgi:hypothetical protein
MPETFKAFDFFDEATRTATSAKTLDTRALGYLDRPSRIYGQLRRYVDQIDWFDKDESGDIAFGAGDIDIRRLELAIPLDTTPEQVVQIQRAIDYAESLGIKMVVSFIK